MIPMLPEKLCNEYCSLMPNQLRCAVVMDMKITKGGVILWNEVNIYPAIIESRRRFTYQEVNDYFNGISNLPNDPKEIKELLDLGKKLYKLMDHKRMEKGYVRLENPETKLELNDQGDVVSFKSYRRDDSQFMIENFMIAANEGVARYLSSKKIPGIYRTHDKPEINKILSFINEANKVNFNIKPVYSNISQSLICN